MMKRRCSAATLRPEAESTNEPLRELTLGRSLSNRGEIPVTPSSSLPKARHDDLLDLESRCRRKSEAAHRAAERLRRNREGNEVPIESVTDDPAMLAWGEQLVNSFYWLQSAAVRPSVDVAVVDHVGGCFEAAAEALALVRVMLDEHPGNSKVLERSLPLVAEAQSALRAAVERLGGDRRSGPVGSLRVAEDNGRPAPCLHQAVSCGPMKLRSRPVGLSFLARIESAGSGSKQARLADVAGRAGSGARRRRVQGRPGATTTTGRR